MIQANNEQFSEDQKNYLQGFVTGADTARTLRGLPTLANAMDKLIGQPVNLTRGMTQAATGGGQAIGPDAEHYKAWQRTEAEGGKLCKEEKAKRDKNALDMWTQMQEDARAGQFPKGTDVFLYKFHGLFFVAPAQNAYMCRLRFAGGILTAHQFKGVAELAEKFGGGYTHVTTRANLQIREIGPGNGVKILTGLEDLGIIIRGSGADNIRNITASPTAGIDPQELIDTRPLAREMHHHILHHRDLYGLPRKFNIAFDGGGRVSSVADTNDIGLTAVRISEANATESLPAGVYFRMELGGITGHGDFARDTGILLKPDECISAATAVVKTFIRHGDRTNREKARLKYLLDAWGFEKFLSEAEKELPFKWRRVDLSRCENRQPVDRFGHVGVHRQKQESYSYIGVSLPVGKMTVEQMRGLAEIVERYGSGVIRLTVWQNLLISDVANADLDAVKQAIESLDLEWRATSFRAGLVACTGNTGCKFSASDTKTHAVQIAEHLEAKLRLDQPLNIHLTGCKHSCAQHYIGDIGLLGASVSQDDDLVEGYHIYAGGGSGSEQHIGRELVRDVPADQCLQVVERIVRGYLEHRASKDESFVAFANRHEVEALRKLCSLTAPADD